ncbi:MAG: alpha-ketoglutarate-dependent dioxygenase AlkB [Chloroflexota bacterium]|nr:alpha-ketoglutarate-dependent dioxygenase AlkB [Chloroflexota bacterium]
MAQSSTRRRPIASEPPQGFGYWPDLIDVDHERRLLDEIAAMPFEEFVFRGVAARRRVVHYGWGYDFESRGLTTVTEPPASLVALRDELAPLADRPAERYEEVLVTEYRPGATIGWHRDAPAFGSTVIGVSLASACRMRFRRKRGDAWETWERALEPRSVYVLSGAARTSWQHSIPPTPELRYSITYRTIREGHRPDAG